MLVLLFVELCFAKLYFQIAYCFLIDLLVVYFCFAATNVNQGHDITTPAVHVADINRVLAFNGQGTHLSGRARADQMFLSYRASYCGFIDRCTRAADDQGLVAASASD